MNAAGAGDRHLLLLRHGKSDWSDESLVDFERALAPRGRRAANLIGRWLCAASIVPELVISSPALRARQTTERVCRRAALGLDRVRWEQSIYEAGVETLLALLKAVPSPTSGVLLVGHNPGLEELLRLLVGDAAARGSGGKLLPTAALAWIEIGGDWRDIRARCGRLRDLVRPRELARAARG